jgi:hypothetical protein
MSLSQIYDTDEGSNPVEMKIDPEKDEAANWGGQLLRQHAIDPAEQQEAFLDAGVRLLD